MKLLMELVWQDKLFIKLVLDQKYQFQVQLAKLMIFMPAVICLAITKHYGMIIIKDPQIMMYNLMLSLNGSQMISVRIFLIKKKEKKDNLKAPFFRGFYFFIIVLFAINTLRSAQH